MLKARNQAVPIVIPPPIRDARHIGRFAYDVCRALKSIRDRKPIIYGSLRTSSTVGGLDPWQPSFFTEGTEPSLTYKCRFNLGTVNQVVASNWNDAFTLSMGEDEYHFVVLTITTASGKVTGVSISVDSTAPSEDYIAKDTPPVTFKIVLGAIGRTEAKMIVRTNLEAVAAEVYRESEAAPSTGAEPFHRWWRWDVDAA